MKYLTKASCGHSLVISTSENPLLLFAQWYWTFGFRLETFPTKDITVFQVPKAKQKHFVDSFWLNDTFLRNDNTMIRLIAWEMSPYMSAALRHFRYNIFAGDNREQHCEPPVALLASYFAQPKKKVFLGGGAKQQAVNLSVFAGYRCKEWRLNDQVDASIISYIHVRF